MKPNFATKLLLFSLSLILLLSFTGIAEAAQATAAPTATPFAITPTPANSNPASASQARPTPAVTIPLRPSPVATTVRPGATLQPTATPVPHPKLVTKPPTVSAAGAIAIEVDTGRILYAKDPHRQLPMASTTKIMTALTLLSMPGIDLNAKTLIVPDDLVGEANMALYSGERISLMSLLIGLMTNSANEAGMALARYGGSLLPGAAGPVERFVARMNAHAQELGMYDSHYSNPHGLDQDGHYSSAFDLAISGWYSLRYPTLVNLMQIDSYRAEGHSFYNVNNFLRRYPGANGIKPGLTDNAGRCLIASATNYGHTVIVVVLNAPDLVNDVDTMMDYSFSLLNQQAELQAEPAGLPPYIGLPDGDRLIPFDTRPLFDFFRALGTGAGSWFQAVRRKS